MRSFAFYNHKNFARIFKYCNVRSFLPLTGSNFKFRFNHILRVTIGYKQMHKTLPYRFFGGNLHIFLAGNVVNVFCAVYVFYFKFQFLRFIMLQSYQFIG